MMVAALAVVSCAKSEIAPLTGKFPDATEVQYSSVTADAEMDETGRRLFTLDFTGSTPMHLVLVGNKYFLTANQYTEAIDAVAKNGNFILGESTIGGKNIKQGFVNVELLQEIATEEGCENAYSISTIVFLEDGTPYKTSWKGDIAFEKDAILEPEFYYTDTVANDCTDSDNVAYPDVESHTLYLTDKNGDFAAQIKLIRPNGTKDLAGTYTVKEYAHEDLTAGNGFDMSQYVGLPDGSWVIGSYYVQDGNVVIIQPGETITVTAMGDGMYTIDGSTGYSFFCAPEGYVPGAKLLNTVMNVTNYFELYAGYDVHLIGIELSDGSVTSTYDAATWSNVYSGEGDFLKLEFYTEDGKVKPGVYKACAVGGSVGEGEFGIGYTGDYGPGSGTNWVHHTAAGNQFENVLDGTLTIGFNDGKFTFTLESEVVTASFTGPVDGLLAEGQEPPIPTFKYNPSEEYLAATNLWLAADEEHFQYPTSGFPTITQDRGHYSFTWDSKTEGQLQLMPLDNIVLSEDRYYKVSAKVWTGAAMKVGVIPASTVNAEKAIGTLEVDCEAYTETVLVFAKTAGFGEPLKMVFTFSGVEEPAEVHIYDITVEDAGDAKVIEIGGLYITDVVSAVTDASWQPVAGVEKHTLTMKDAQNNVVAGWELVIAEGGVLTGEYTCKSYPSEAYLMGNGYDLTAMGWGIGGSYYYKGEELVLIEEGETMTLTANADGTYTFKGNGYIINAKFSVNLEGLNIYDTVGAVTDANYQPVAGVEKHTMTMADAQNNVVAGMELVIAEGGNLAGSYTCKSYPSEDHVMGNGYDLSAWGWGIGGSYYYSGENLVLINEGETMTLVKNADESYTFVGPGYTITGNIVPANQ